MRFLRRPQPTAAGGESPYHTVDVALAPTTGVVTGTVLQLDDDLTARGATGAPTNAAALTARANERAADWLRKRERTDRPFTRAWRDFQPLAVKAVGRSVSKVVYDDSGEEFRTWAVALTAADLERWRPLADYPPWWPFESGAGECCDAPAVVPAGSGSGSGSGSRSGVIPAPSDNGFPDENVPGGQDGKDPIAVRETLCLGGKLFVTRGRQQIVCAHGRLRLDWYGLVTTQEGCCGCSDEGGGSGGAGGSGSGACPEPGSPCCEGSDPGAPLVGVMNGPGGEFVTEFGRESAGVYTAAATDGCAELTVRLRCVGGVWQYESVVRDGAGQLQSVVGSLTVSDDGESLEASIGGYEVSIDHPCPPAGGSGSGGVTPAPTCAEVAPGSLPASLSWVVTGATGAAGCAIGLSGTLYDYGFSAPLRVWEQTSYFNPCGQFTQGLNVRCDGGVYQIGAITAYGGCPGTGGPKYPATSGSVSPFKLVFTVPACWFRDATASPGDTVTVEVTV